MAELNRLSKDGICFTRGRKEPALLLGWNCKIIYTMYAVGIVFGLTGRFTLGYNNLWLLGGLLPGTMTYIANSFRQPQQSIDNAYRYLLEKRSVSAHASATSDAFQEQFADRRKEIDQLRIAFAKRGQTLYDVEADLVNRIAEGKF